MARTCLVCPLMTHCRRLLLFARFGAPDFGQGSQMLAYDTQNLSCFEMQLSRAFTDARNKALTGLHSCLQGRWPPPWSLKQH